MSDQIQEKINKIVEKRKKEIEKYYYKIKDDALGKKDILDAIKIRKQLTKKELKWFKMLYKYNGYKKRVCFYRAKESSIWSCSLDTDYTIKFNEKKYDSRDSWYYPKELYDILIKCANIHLQHQEKYLVKEKKEELYELTKCLKSLEGINPCEKQCETCDITYPLDAQFCSKCGKQLQ